MSIDKIDEFGPTLYRKLGELAKAHKLLLCVEEKEDMKYVVSQMREHA